MVNNAGQILGFIPCGEVHFFWYDGFVGVLERYGRNRVPKFELIRLWVIRAKGQVSQMEELVGSVRPELMGQSERDRIGSLKRMLPHSVNHHRVMWKYLHRKNTPCSAAVPVEYSRMLFEDMLDTRGNKRSRDLSSMSISFPLSSARKSAAEVGTDDNPSYYFRFNNWIRCAHLVSPSNEEQEYGPMMVLNVVGREKSDHPDSSFAEEASLNEIHVYSSVMSASGRHFN